MKIGLSEFIIVFIIGAGIFLFSLLTRKPPPAAPAPIMRRRPAREIEAENNKRRLFTGLKIGSLVLILVGVIIILGSLKMLDFLLKSYTVGAIIIAIGVGFFFWARQR